MKIDNPIPLLEEILDPWKAALGDAFIGYKNHVYRMLHFCFGLRPCSDSDREKLVIAGAFHDLGLWSAGTVDYLPPSIKLAREYLAKTGRSEWTEEVELMIDLHHKIRPVRDSRYPLIEIFRRGDLADFSLGFIKSGLPRSLVNEIQRAFPNAGFHRTLVRLAAGWFVRHPISLPPFMKW